MNFVKNEDFDEYVSKYTLLNKNDKRDIIIKILKENLMLLEKIASDNNLKSNLLYNREILNINKDNYTEDDFLEAVFVYIYSFRELFANYIEFSEGGK